MKNLLGLIFLFPAVAFAQDKQPATPVDLTLNPGAVQQCVQAYPIQALKNDISGSTTLLMRVTTDGRVVGLIIASSSGHATLDDASFECVKTWRFAPMKFDHPTEVAWSTGIRWNFQPGSGKTNLILRAPYNTCVSDPELGALKSGIRPEKTVVSYELLQGKVLSAKVATSSGDAELDHRALNCVNSWQFEPERGFAYIVVVGDTLRSSPHSAPPETLDTVAATGTQTAVFYWAEIGAH